MTDIATNAAEFSRQLDALTDHIEGNITAVIRKACVDLYRRIVERTPVDSGRAKASWSISTTGTDTITEHADGWSHNELLEIIRNNVSDFEFTIHDDKVLIVNNVEYISVLESGNGSGQAPQGMVAVSLAEFSAHFREALAGLEGIELA